MRFVRSNLALVGLSAILMPATVLAQAPAGYAPAPTTMMGPDGRPVAVQPVGARGPAQSAPAYVSAPKPAAAPAAAPAGHKHKFRTLCASCAKKQDMALAGERIVGCAHSANGVCPTCRALLEMPGTVTMGAAPAPAPAPAGEAPGRAVVASNSPAPAAAQPGANVALYDPAMTPEPTPVGLMQTNYSQAGPAAAAASAAPSMGVPTAGSLRPGHAIAESAGNSPAPFRGKPTSSKNPKVISHLLGIGGFGNEWRDARSQRKSEAHASIPYNNDGTTINELPASMVYGNKH